jgi:actin
MDEEGLVTLVIEHSSIIKAGFASDCCPRAVYPCNVSRPIMSPHFMSLTRGLSSSTYYYVGDEGYSKREILQHRLSIDRGYINKKPYHNKYDVWTPWQDVERVLHHTFKNELRVAPEVHPVLLSYNIGHEPSDYEKLSQIAFEQFCVPLLCFTNPSHMSLLASGRTTGTVVNCGHGLTLISSFIDGQALPKHVHTTGGEYITNYLVNLLYGRGYAFEIAAEQKIVNDIKESIGFASLNFEKDLKTSAVSTELEKSYQLPDGRLISVGSERFRAVECLFNPIDQEHVSLQHGVMQVLDQNNMKMWREIMLQNIVLTGNGSSFKNLDHRLQNELDKLAGQSTRVSLTDRYASWTGGSIFASRSLKMNEWISKDEYEEQGAVIIHKHLKKAQYLNPDDTMLQTQEKNKFADLNIVNH